MGELREKLILIMVTSLTTALLSASGTAIYFYFDTKYTMQSFSKQWEDQKKKDEVQDIETRLNTAEINGIKIEMAGFGANVQNMVKLQSEMNADVKKLLRKE